MIDLQTLTLFLNVIYERNLKKIPYCVLHLVLFLGMAELHFNTSTKC